VKIITENQDIPLQYGWFVVQNRGPKAQDSFDREREEKTTFSKRPWNEIPVEQRGTTMLKKFLASLLCRRILETFPIMQRKIGDLLVRERARLTQLGDPRPEHSDRQVYLVSIAEKFQSLANQALRSPEELPADDMKLRGRVQKANREFAQAMREHGHFYRFFEIEESADPAHLQDGPDSASQALEVIQFCHTPEDLFF